MIALFDVRFERLDCIVHDVAQIYPFALQVQAPVSDPGYVQKVIDESGHSAHLPFDHRFYLRRRRSVLRLMAQKSDPVVDRCKRVPQLMTEYRQKLVLAAVGEGQLLHSQSRLAQCV